MFVSVTTIPPPATVIINVTFYHVPRHDSKYLTYIRSFKSRASPEVSAIIFHLLKMRRRGLRLRKEGRVSAEVQWLDTGCQI